MADVVTLLAHDGAAANSSLGNVDTIFDIISKTVTAVAVIVGGLWAYFKFVRGRTYRPRLEIDLGGQWWMANGSWLLHARVAVKNVGASKVELLQKGTGLKVSVPSSVRPAPPASVSWVSKKVFVTLNDHAWIESAETITDNLLLDLGIADASPALLEMRLVAGRRSGNVVFFARDIVPRGAAANEVHPERAEADGSGQVALQDAPEDNSARTEAGGS